MALYRTDRRLNWHNSLRIGHWYAPWSQTQADTGTDYFSRTLRWLRHHYPKAVIDSHSHALPAANAGWPQEHFGLPPEQTQTAENTADAAPTPIDSETEETAHAGDLLLIEWPQPLAEDSEQASGAPQATDPSVTGDNQTATPAEQTLATSAGQTPAIPDEQHPATPAERNPAANAEETPATPAKPATNATLLPPLWINGLERALRRHWQDNPLSEVLFIGGLSSIPKSGLALAAHYGITVLDPAQLLRPADAGAPDHRQALICESKGNLPATLTPQGHEIWAGMLIGLLRQQVRYGPTPTPVSLPEGLWCR